MTDNYFVGAYWSSRAESAEQCAGRLSLCLERLRAVHPALALWYRKGSSKAAASKDPVGASTDELLRLLLGGRNRRDADGSVIEELGFRASLWNKNEIDVGFSTICGSHLNSKSVMNNFGLQLPAPEGGALELYEDRVVEEIVSALAEAWEPEWVTWASYSMRSDQAAAPGSPVFGWLTYLSSSNLSADDCPELPQGVTAVGAFGGTMIRLPGTPVSASAGEATAVRDVISPHLSA
jgi:hypothetical protein